jgi:hypothetical protein
LAPHDRELGVVLAGELVANADVHANTDGELQIRHDRRWLTISVRRQLRCACSPA